MPRFQQRDKYDTGKKLIRHYFERKKINELLNNHILFLIINIINQWSAHTFTEEIDELILWLWLSTPSS